MESQFTKLNKFFSKLLSFKLPISFIFLFLLSACATQYQDATVHDPYGFFSGILHGFVWFPALIISFFSDFTVVGMPNTGGGYVFGFIIGVIMSLELV